MRRLVSIILVSVVFAWTGRAAAVTVAVVRPSHGLVVTPETLVRISLELTSAGFETEIVDGSAVRNAPDGLGSTAWLESLGVEERVEAVVAIVGEVAPTGVEVWVMDKVSGRSLVRRIPLDATAVHAETLAVRALELLRSSFLELELTAGTARQGPQAGVPAPLHPVQPERLAVEVGAVAVMSPGGIGPAILPTVHLGWALRPALLVYAALAGLGTHPQVVNSVGSAQINQEYGALGAAYRFGSSQRLRPFVALSAGAFHTVVEGRSGPPNQGQRVQQWSLLLDGGMGTALRVHDRFYLALAAHVQLVEPYVAIRFVDTVVATHGRPNLVLALSIGAWL